MDKKPDRAVPVPFEVHQDVVEVSHKTGIKIRFIVEQALRMWLKTAKKAA